MAELPPLDSPEFAGVRGELARAIVANKASMGMEDWPEEWLIAHVDDVAVVLMALTEHAIRIDDRDWLRRHLWFRGLAFRLERDLEGAPLDG